MLQILIFSAVFIAIIFPIGKYLYHIAVGKRTFADPVFDRVDNGIYRVCGIDRFSIQTVSEGWNPVFPFIL